MIVEKYAYKCIPVLRGCYFFLSWLIAAAAQPDISSICSCLTGAMTYGILWFSLCPSFSKPIAWKKLGVLSFLWMASVEGVHFSWMLSDLYVGRWIALVWLTLICCLGGIFALFTCGLFFIAKERPKLLWFMPGVWVVLESCRYYYLLSGVSLDFLGFPLTATAYGRHFGSFFGWAGQSFVVAASNIGFYVCLLGNRCARQCWCFFALFPYFLGGIGYEYGRRSLIGGSPIRIAIVQPGAPSFTQHPLQLWQTFIELAQTVEKPIDLLIFPEVAVAFGTKNKVYPAHVYQQIISSLMPISVEEGIFLSNTDYAQTLARYFQCPVVIGLERHEVKQGRNYVYNAAECVLPDGGTVGYDKRILVPGGEYIPGGTLGEAICRKFFPSYASASIRVPGTKSGILHLAGLPKIGLSICYEETFGFLLRPYKVEGAELLVNLTNDGWYPKSRLPQVHFHHGILRNQELGLPCIRACHTGITVAADALGRVLKVLPYEDSKQKAVPGVLQVDLLVQTLPTLYSIVGDIPVLFCSLLSAVSIFICILPKRLFYF